MASNSLGNQFRITTWGESHGKAIGVVIDGCPPLLPLSDEDINCELRKRRPGRAYTSPRQEKDEAEILSGLFEGKTTGAPLSIIIWNVDVDSSGYDAVQDLYRPGHAQYSYLKKYGIFDHRGGGRASARETACRVAAGAVAKKLLRQEGITLQAHLYELGGIPIEKETQDPLSSPLFCPDPAAERKMCALLDSLNGDSVGGIVEMRAQVPAGLGDPIFAKLEAQLAHAMLTIPASKGVEFGEGFASARSRGSLHNDLFTLVDEEVTLATNKAGGTLGGISTGQPIILRVAFKPTSTILRKQPTVSLKKERTVLTPPGKRHDPCVAIRAVPVVEAMGALTLLDSWLLWKRQEVMLHRDNVTMQQQQDIESSGSTQSPLAACGNVNTDL